MSGSFTALIHGDGGESRRRRVVELRSTGGGRRTRAGVGYQLSQMRDGNLRHVF